MFAWAGIRCCASVDYSGAIRTIHFIGEVKVSTHDEFVRFRSRRPLDVAEWTLHKPNVCVTHKVKSTHGSYNLFQEQYYTGVRRYD